MYVGGERVRDWRAPGPAVTAAKASLRLSAGWKLIVMKLGSGGRSGRRLLLCGGSVGVWRSVREPAKVTLSLEGMDG